MYGFLNQTNKPIINELSLLNFKQFFLQNNISIIILINILSQNNKFS